jgi:hypothetical protein
MDLGLFFFQKWLVKLSAAPVPICESPFGFDKQLVATATVCQQKAKISHVPPPTTHHPVNCHPSSVLVTHHPPPTIHPSSIIHRTQPPKSIMDYDLPHLICKLINFCRAKFSLGCFGFGHHSTTNNWGTNG